MIYSDLARAIEPYTQLVEKLKRQVALTKENEKLLKTVVEKVDSGNITWKDTFNTIINTYSDQFLELLRGEAISAAIKSVEYAYPLYLNRLSEAIGLCEISISITGKSIEVRINPNPMGEVGTWAKAAELARGGKKGALTRFQTHSSGENLALRIWREKIYGAAREGKPVNRRKYNFKTKTYENINVTSEFRGKYYSTIKERLSYVGGAPFWYLIEHGNSNPPGFDNVATAYPEVKEQNFIDKARRRIKGFIAEKIQELLPTIDKEWIGNISTSLAMPITPKLKDLLSKYGSSVAIKLNNLELIKELSLNSIIGEITLVDKTYNIIKTSKSIGLQYKLGKRK